MRLCAALLVALACSACSLEYSDNLARSRASGATAGSTGTSSGSSGATSGSSTASASTGPSTGGSSGTGASTSSGSSGSTAGSSSGSSSASGTTGLATSGTGSTGVNGTSGSGTGSTGDINPPVLLLNTNGYLKLATDRQLQVVAVRGVSQWELFFPTLGGGTTYTVDATALNVQAASVAFTGTFPAPLVVGGFNAGSEALAVLSFDGGSQSDAGLSLTASDTFSGKSLDEALPLSNGEVIEVFNDTFDRASVREWSGAGAGSTRQLGDGGTVPATAAIGDNVYVLQYSGDLSRYDLATTSLEPPLHLGDGSWTALDSWTNSFTACGTLPDGGGIQSVSGTVQPDGGLFLFGTQLYALGMNAGPLSCSGDEAGHFAMLYEDFDTAQLYVTRTVVLADAGTEQLGTDQPERPQFFTTNRQLVVLGTGEVFFITNQGIYDWPAPN